MPESVPRNTRPFDLEKALDLIAALAALLAPAAVFYALGYIVIQAYVVAVQVNATFWFNEYFYREAGASFLLATVGAIVLLPHFFVLLSAALLLFFPVSRGGGRRNQLLGSRPADASPGSGGSVTGASLPQVTRQTRTRTRIFLAVIFAALAAMLLLLKNVRSSGWPGPQDLWRSASWLFTDAWIFPQWFIDYLNVTKPLRYPTALFLALALPVLAALAAKAYCALREGSAQTRDECPQSVVEQKHKFLSGLLWLVATLVVGCYVAIGYGAFFFDVTAMALVDPEKCRPVAAEKADTNLKESKIQDCFLLARLDERYILFGFETRPSSAPGDPRWGSAPLYVKQVKDTDPFSLMMGPGQPLRGLRASYDDRKYAPNDLAKDRPSETEKGP